MPKASHRGKRSAPPITPDGRYFVVRGRLWRCTDPSLSEDRKASLVAELMALRRSLRQTSGLSPADRRLARERLHACKCALGERGPPWWGEGTETFDRALAVHSPYRDWYLRVEAAGK